MNPKLLDLRDALSEKAFGMKRSDAHKAKVCVSCKEPALNNIKDERDYNEYKISGLCGKCWNKIFSEDEAI